MYEHINKRMHTSMYMVRCMTVLLLKLEGNTIANFFWFLKNILLTKGLQVKRNKRCNLHKLGQASKPLRRVLFYCNLAAWTWLILPNNFRSVGVHTPCLLPFTYKLLHLTRTGTRLITITGSRMRAKVFGMFTFTNLSN